MLKVLLYDFRRGAGGVVFRGRDNRFDTLALPSPVALQLGFMWGARVPGWDGLGAIWSPKWISKVTEQRFAMLRRCFATKFSTIATLWVPIVCKRL